MRRHDLTKKDSDKDNDKDKDKDKDKVIVTLAGRRGGASKEPGNSGGVWSLHCYVGSGKDCASECECESESECECESECDCASECECECEIHIVNVKVNV